MAVLGGRIAFVGSSDEAQNWIGDGTRVIELQGRTAIPGFIEGAEHQARYNEQDHREGDLNRHQDVPETRSPLAEKTPTSPPV